MPSTRMTALVCVWRPLSTTRSNTRWIRANRRAATTIMRCLPDGSPRAMSRIRSSWTSSSCTTRPTTVGRRVSGQETGAALSPVPATSSIASAALSPSTCASTGPTTKRTASLRSHCSGSSSSSPADRIEGDEILDGPAEPVVEAGEFGPPLEARAGEVVHHRDIALVDVPGGHVIVVLPDGEQDQVAVRVPLPESLEAISQQLALHDPPRLEVRQAKLDHTDELRGVLEVRRKIVDAQQVGHATSRSNRSPATLSDRWCGTASSVSRCGS